MGHEIVLLPEKPIRVSLKDLIRLTFSRIASAYSEDRKRHSVQQVRGQEVWSFNLNNVVNIITTAFLKVCILYRRPMRKNHK